MYHGYNSLRESIQREIESQKSVLNKFPESIGRPITQSCSKHLAQFTSFQLPFKAEPTATTTSSIGNVTNVTSSANTGSSSSSSTTGGTKTNQQASDNLSDLNYNNVSQGLLSFSFFLINDTFLRIFLFY